MSKDANGREIEEGEYKITFKGNHVIVKVEKYQTWLEKKPAYKFTTSKEGISLVNPIPAECFEEGVFSEYRRTDKEFFYYQIYL